MKISVSFFARARDLAAVPKAELDIPVGTTVGELRETLAEKFAALRPLLPRLFIAVGTEYAKDDVVIPENAEVACFPPVSGG